MKRLTQITLVLIISSCISGAFAQSSWSVDVGTPHFGFSYSKGRNYKHVGGYYSSGHHYVAPSYRHYRPVHRPVYRSYNSCAPTYSTYSYSYSAPVYSNYSYSYSTPSYRTYTPSYSQTNVYYNNSRSYPRYNSHHSRPRYTQSTYYSYPTVNHSYTNYRYNGCGN